MWKEWNSLVQNAQCDIDEHYVMSVIVSVLSSYIGSAGRAMRFEIFAVAQVINLVFKYIHGGKSIGYITITVIALIFRRIFMSEKKKIENEQKTTRNREE